MKINRFSTILLCMLLLFTVSCTSYKKVPYLQNSGELPSMEQNTTMFDAKVQPKDLLIITVVSPKDPTASAVYNLTTGIPYDNRFSLTSQPTLQSYLVDNDGCIVFPVIGEINVAGKTKKEIENLIADKIKGAFTEPPIVNVRFENFKISILGEVNSPGTYTIKNEKVNVFEALALAKDLTVYGLRENVKLIRENSNGKKEIHELNLNDVSIVTSPYYYLQQNDILYVTPNKAKAKNSDIGSSTSLWFSATSIMISLTSLLYNILR
ncbi:MAG: polysaccharide biosynthesis/export family protein [Bacteroidaceae bacterium]|nr:polysaccharide biosynthesis/export family protein [Bacteroidaceae bacterium]